MRERILFLTGRLAQSRLEKVLQGMEPTAFDWSVFSVGVKVAALMTEPILMRRLPRPINAGRVVDSLRAQPGFTARALRDLARCGHAGQIEYASLVSDRASSSSP